MPNYNAFPYPQQYGYQMPNQQIQPQYQPQIQSQPQIQNGGFMPIQGEESARNYPIAFGNSITFKDENAPYIYVKTMGFSQMESPTFEKYRLVKEEPKTNGTAKTDQISYEDLENEIKTIKNDMKDIRNKVEMMDRSKKFRKEQSNDSE